MHWTDNYCERRLSQNQVRLRKRFRLTNKSCSLMNTCSLLCCRLNTVLLSRVSIYLSVTQQPFSCFIHLSIHSFKSLKSIRTKRIYTNTYKVCSKEKLGKTKTIETCCPLGSVIWLDRPTTSWMDESVHAPIQIAAMTTGERDLVMRDLSGYRTTQ